MDKLKIKVIMLAIGLILTGCGGSDSSSDVGATLRKILVIGDSIGNGAGIAVPYPVRIESATGVPVVNDSVSGRLTGEGLAVAEGLLSVHQPSHLVVLLGTNDARRDISNTLSNLQTIIGLGNAAGAKVVIGTLPPLTNSADDDTRAAIVSDGIRGTGGAAIAEVRNAMGDGSTTIADGIHPNDAGQQIIAGEFLKHLQ